MRTRADSGKASGDRWAEVADVFKVLSGWWYLNRTMLFGVCRCCARLKVAIASDGSWLGEVPR